MKTLIIASIFGISLFVGTPAMADVLGDSDDRYIGIQLSIPLDGRGKNLFDRPPELNALLIDQADGYKQGIVYTRHGDGVETLDYLAPSQAYRIGQDSLSNYTTPIVNLSEPEPYQSNLGAIPLLIGVVVVGAVAIQLIHDSTESVVEVVDCIDPQVDSQTIEGC